VVSSLVLGLIALPLLGSALIMVMPQRIHPSSAHRVALTATGLTALCALALLPHAGDGLAITVEWLPGTGPMGLTTGATGLYAVLVTTWGAFLVLLGTTSRSAERPRLSGVVMLLALAGANVAFLTEHFLARYVALEVVALCIALALLVEMRNSLGVRLAWGSYLLLRLGDAGLLTGILILVDASGTLSISPALEAAGALDPTRLGLVVAGFVLAVWVKVSGWPFHLWSQPARRLTLASHAWLYATVMPNLGIYLLYRVTPLLALVGPLQAGALWLGAGGAALAALIALTQADLRTALVYLGAAQGGLLLFVAASGVKPVVWMGLLAVTPLRLLLFLAADAAYNSDSPARRTAAVCLFALGGLAVAAFGLLTTYWAREAGARLDALLVAEAAVALTGVWTARAAWRLSRPRSRVAKGPAIHWTQWMTVGLLGTGVLAGGLASVALARHLAAASRMALPDIPTLSALLRYAATAPAVLVVMVLALVVWRLQAHSSLAPFVSAQPPEEVYDLAEGLARAAQVLHAVIEVGIAEQIVALAVRAVVDGAHVTYRVVEHSTLERLLRRSVRAVVDGARVTYRVVEHNGLERLWRGSVRAVVEGARVTHRVVEHEGLEAVLGRSVRSVLVLSRGLQRSHTGRLRRNLLWVSVSLGLAVVVLLLYGG
jgi:formate hydrogenlyase subunit 3/multisubunit Na+/H+ antiporter MnhD subunit